MINNMYTIGQDYCSSIVYNTTIRKKFYLSNSVNLNKVNTNTLDNN
jgi:hypothetical protein